MANAGFEAFLWSITMQESGGGEYKTIGPQTKYGHAYGRYQVLLGNIGPWTAKYWGRILTPQQFLNTPAAQDAVVRGKLGEYYQQYGARGAAAMWYSGQPNPNKTYGDPPVYKHVNDVVDRAGDYSGQSIGVGSSSGAGTGSTYSVQAVTPKLDKYEMAEQFGLTWSTISANGELKNLFNKAVKEGWDATLFAAKLKNTKWWKTTSDSARKFFMLKTGDPATYKQKWKSNQYAVNALAVAVGLSSQVNTKGQSSAILQKAILYKMRDGWSDARIKSYFGTMVTLHGAGAGAMYGEAGEAYDQVFALAYANGQSYSKSWYQEQIRRVVSGKTTLEALQGQIRNTAASKYFAFADQIRAGQNVIDLAQPYVSAVAQILELPQTDIDLGNKWVTKAMTSKTAAGAQAGTQYPMWKFENDLRSDPLWKKTNNARESMFSVAHQVAKDFGMAF